jgi:anthranilate synthase/aminodeoxychorismate synthase-like glutamine amidotransferase
MILLIDNYDSFVHNLARYVRELGGDAVVRRNDELSLCDIERLAPSHIILSPGPCAPAQAGISTDIVRRFGPTTPVLGVCLGHQCIGAAYGAEIIRAGRPVHGRTSSVTHDGSGIFAGLPSPIVATRYHSLVIARRSLPESLRVIASSDDDGEIMAVEHISHPVVGVQFHPESAASEYGYAIINRFLTQRGKDQSTTLPRWADGIKAPNVHGPATESAPPWASPSDARTETFVPPPVTLVR